MMMMLQLLNHMWQLMLYSGHLAISFLVFSTYVKSTTQVEIQYSPSTVVLTSRYIKVCLSGYCYDLAIPMRELSFLPSHQYMNMNRNNSDNQSWICVWLSLSEISVQVCEYVRIRDVPNIFHSYEINERRENNSLIGAKLIRVL